MIDELTSIDWDASRSSFTHNLDARVKLILVLFMIILIVSYPLSWGIVYIAIPFGMIIAGLWALSTLPVRTYLTRFVMTLPFGFFIIFFQIFFKNSHYQTATEIPMPFPFFPVYYESVEFATLLLLKFLLCISAILLLSSTTPMQELLKAGRRLGLPSVMALSLGMMIRYLFLFATMYTQIHHALQGRNFDPWAKNLPYRYRIRTLGYAMGVLFLRAYEQGERTYSAMLCRGYGSHALDHLQKKALTHIDLIVLTVLGVAMPVITVSVFILYG
ncbi:cobalt ECF transporter T component CbiQ [Methanospirillum lacunae]|uniref:Cobalt ECF transporter T component CbiQ n=1 Tax=Methanospirillum lacunae TaxID=668570 RepID=A0A2V2NBT4_9EURY|nr:cobalt ECF transporter T component CbiQ [Methanospirillum lacunae]PWR73807.1 cobalt ECF transporter T component CbiQ [Methanospirillum lacunae]